VHAVPLAFRLPLRLKRGQEPGACSLLPAMAVFAHCHRSLIEVCRTVSATAGRLSSSGEAKRLEQAPDRVSTDTAVSELACYGSR